MLECVCSIEQSRTQIRERSFAEGYHRSTFGLIFRKPDTNEKVRFSPLSKTFYLRFQSVEETELEAETGLFVFNLQLPMGVQGFE
jgi:hypothetical protein